MFPKHFAAGLEAFVQMKFRDLSNQRNTVSQAALHNRKRYGILQGETPLNVFNCETTGARMLRIHDIEEVGV